MGSVYRIAFLQAYCISCVNRFSIKFHWEDLEGVGGEGGGRGDRDGEHM